MEIRLTITAIVLVLSCHFSAAGQTCTPLLPVKEITLIEYLRKQYKIGEEQGVKLTKQQPIANSCYSELTFEGTSSMKSWQLTLYLSPDQRFLTGELFDTTLDPIEQERKKAAELMTSLAQNKGASRGPELAPVTIVEFSDFQCPYCRKFAEIMEQILPSEKDNVRVVFHHLPLSMHPWARLAAEGAACAQLQSSEAFWSLHAQLFHHQQEITPGNIKDKLTEFAQGTKLIDPKTFQSCVDNQMSLGLVFRDMDLASSNQVTGTPTLFVNGHRVAGVKDAAQLRQLISEALKDAPASIALNAGAPKK
jgi:protein-disulfide isomerase